MGRFEYPEPGNEYRVPGTDYRVCRVRFFVLLLLSVASGGLIRAQQATNASVITAPTVTFTLDFPKSNPSHYSIAVDASGRARYECTAIIADDSQAEPYRTEFELSKANRERIFAWAKQAKFFAGKIDSGNRKLAFTGAKVLSYQDGARSNTAQFNYSNLEPVRELTDFFQKMDGTLEYGRRLAYYHRYQKLALDQEIKSMQAQATSGELTEIGTVAPVLQQIVDDNSVINVVRARAQELIQMGNAAGH